MASLEGAEDERKTTRGKGEEEKKIRTYPLREWGRFFGQLNRSHGIAPWESLFRNARIEALSLPGSHATSASRHEGRWRSREYDKYSHPISFSSICILARLAGSFSSFFVFDTGSMDTYVDRERKHGRARVRTRQGLVGKRRRRVALVTPGSHEVVAGWWLMAGDSGGNPPPHEFLF